MGGDLSVQNNTGIDLLCVLSQVGPLHWETVYAGQTKTIGCGQVWFTLTGNLYNGKEPSDWEVAAPFVYGGIATVAAVCSLGGAVIAEAGAGAALGVVGAVGGGISDAVLLTNTAHRCEEARKKEMYAALSTHWKHLGATDSSAQFLANNGVVRIVPACEKGVYANGKTVLVTGHLETDSLSKTATYTVKFHGA